MFKYFSRIFSVVALLSFLVANLTNSNFLSINQAKADATSGLTASLDNNGSYPTGGGDMNVMVGNASYTGSSPVTVELGIYRCKKHTDGSCAGDYSGLEENLTRTASVNFPSIDGQDVSNQISVPRLSANCGMVQVDLAINGHVFGGKSFDLGSDCTSPQTCEKDKVVGTTKDANGCTRNIHQREDCTQYEGGPYACPVSTCEKDKVVGTTKDANGCTRNIHQREDCSTYEGGPFACPETPQNNQFCFLCDGGKLRPAGAMSDCTGTNAPQCPSIGGPYNACLSSSNNMTDVACGSQPSQPGVTCPAGTTLINGVCQPNVSCPQGTTFINGICQPNITCPSGTTLVNGQCQANVVTPPQGGDITVNPVFNNNPTNTNTSTNTNTNTITNNVAREVVREVVQSGNVGVGASVVSVAGSSAVALPKTGLPALAWALAAFIPAGFRMKKFGKGLSADDGAPNYLWESREFKRS